MVDLTALRQAARKTKDENGKDVVQIPLEVWEETVEADEVEEAPLSQIERIMAVIKKWEAVPDDKSAEWWDEFETFLKENRFDIPERDLGFDEE